MELKDTALRLWEDGLVCFDPEIGDWVLREVYCSGDIVQKLEVLDNLARGQFPEWIEATLGKNRELLEAVKPAPCLPSADMRIKLEVCERLGIENPSAILDNTFSLAPNTHWLEPTIIANFIADTFEIDPESISVNYLESINWWQIRAPSYGYKARVIYGVPKMNGIEILEKELNSAIPIKILKEGELDHEATASANAKREELVRLWHEWIFADPDRATALTKEYNRRYRSRLAREYDGTHLTLAGCRATLRDYQKDAVWQILQRQSTLLPHKVGWGKTWIMIAAIMELKRLGLAQKPMLVGLKSTIPQLKEQFLQLYPQAKLIVAEEESFTAKGRQKLFSQIATATAVDCVILAHSQFFYLKASLETERAFIMEEINNIKRAVSASRSPIKGLQKRLKTLTEKLDTIHERKDNLIDWNILGIDALFIDEFHYFKNLQYTTRMQVAGLSNSGCQRSLDTLLKIMEIRARGGRIVAATGTPIANSISEIYTLQRYLDYDTLKRLGLTYFDQWASQFARMITCPEVTITGEYALKTRFSSFQNVPELLGLLQEFKATPRQGPHIKLPEAQHITITSPSSPEQTQYMEILAKRAEQIRRKQVPPEIDNLPKINTDGRKCFIDPKLVIPSAPNYPYSKLNRAAITIMAIYQATRQDQALQLVFCDFSTPHPTKHNAYRYLKDTVVALGMPAHKFAIIHEEDDLDQLYQDARAGKISVLMGSTNKLGTGVNVQDRVIAHHDLDATYRPCDMEQRLGRSIRYGNQYPQVYVIRYVTAGDNGRASFEATLWQRLETKQRFYNQINNNQVSSREIEDFDEVVLSYAQIKACAIANPLILERANLEMEIAKLKIEQKNQTQNNCQILQEIKKLEARQTTIPQLMAKITKDVHQIPATLELTADNQIVPAKNCQLHIKQKCIQAKAQMKEIPIGTIGDFTVHANPISLTVTTPNHQYLVSYTKNPWQELTEWFHQLPTLPHQLNQELETIPHKISELHKAYDHRDLKALVQTHTQRIDQIDILLARELEKFTSPKTLDPNYTCEIAPPYAPPDPDLIAVLAQELADFHPPWLPILTQPTSEITTPPTSKTTETIPPPPIKSTPEKWEQLTLF